MKTAIFIFLALTNFILGLGGLAWYVGWINEISADSLFLFGIGLASYFILGAVWLALIGLFIRLAFN